MSVSSLVRSVAVSLAVSGMLVPAAPLRAEAPRHNGAALPVVHDVALGASGVLCGRVVDPQGAAADGAPVVVLQNGVELARTRTDRDGAFAVSGLRGGVYHLFTEDGSLVCRSWAPGTAPPAAAAEVLLVRGSDAHRGQMPLGAALLSDPLVVGLIIAAAIAIPIAIHNSRRSGS